jgi:molybdate/tungstate transport system substrate-binding protein
MASADYTVIDTLLVPEHADWNLRFAANEMVIAYRSDSRLAEKINADNWYEILLREDITFGRSDPNLDPCGYRSLLTVKLAEKFYNQPGLFARISAKDHKYVRPKETDLLALLEIGELDYIFMYKSVTQQHKLEMLALPDQINLKKAQLSDYYKTASLRITGKTKGSLITKAATPIVYGVTMPKSAPNPVLAEAFLQFLLDRDRGGAIMKRCGQNFLVPAPTPSFENLPQSLKTFALPSNREVRK